MKKQLTVGRVVCDLLFRSLIGMVVFGVSYARYTSSVSGSATGAVAALALDGKITSAWIDIGNMQPGDSKTIPFEVVNFSGDQTSEVEQEYLITVKTSGNLPLSFALTSSLKAGKTAGALQESNGAWKSESAGILPPAVQSTHSYTLTVTWKTEDGNRMPDYMDEIDSVVDARQVLPSEK